MSCMDKYDILEQIGEGAYGRIYRARDKEDGKIVVLKTVRLEGLDQREQTDALNEIRVMERIDHPNIVKFYDTFLDGENGIVTVMEYLSGGDLSNVISKHRKDGKYLSENNLWRYCIEMSLGFNYLHNMGIIHRDIKPSNIIINNPTENKLKIADFGFGKVLKGNLAYSAVGTPLYMSPEIVQGLGYDAKSDIWSLGCVMYELASLELAFPAETEAELAKKVLTKTPAPLPAHFSKDLTTLIFSMMTKDPTKRPSAQDILDYEPLKMRMTKFNLTEGLGEFPEEEAEIMKDLKESTDQGQSVAYQLNRVIAKLAQERHNNKALAEELETTKQELERVRKENEELRGTKLASSSASSGVPAAAGSAASSAASAASSASSAAAASPAVNKLVPFKPDYLGLSPPLPQSASVGAIYAWKKGKGTTAGVRYGDAWNAGDVCSFAQNTTYFVIMFRGCDGCPYSKGEIKSMQVKTTRDAIFKNVFFSEGSFKSFGSGANVWYCMWYKASYEVSDIKIDFKSVDTISEVIILRGKKLESGGVSLKGSK